MNKLKNMRLTTMLGIGFAVMIIIGFFVALFARMQLVAVGHNMNYSVDVRLVNLQLINDIKDNNTENAYDIKSYPVCRKTPSFREGFYGTQDKPIE